MAARTDRLDLIERALALPIKPPRRKLVMVTMARFADADGSNCFPGVDKLAEVTGFHRRWIQRDLRDLEAENWITPYKHAGGGRGKTKVYQLNIPVSRGEQMPLELDVKDGVSATVSETEKGGGIEPKRVADSLEKGGGFDIAIRSTNNYQNTNTYTRDTGPLPDASSAAHHVLTQLNLSGTVTLSGRGNMQNIASAIESRKLQAPQMTFTEIAMEMIAAGMVYARAPCKQNWFAFFAEGLYRHPEKLEALNGNGINQSHRNQNRGGAYRSGEPRKYDLPADAILR